MRDKEVWAPLSPLLLWWRDSHRALTSLEVTGTHQGRLSEKPWSTRDRIKLILHGLEAVGDKLMPFDTKDTIRQKYQKGKICPTV